jgi:hypothetical protein
MARPKGQPKLGGRQKGTPNKRPTVSELCARRGFDPFVVMIEIAQDENNDAALRGKMAAELARYLEPQKKAVELSNPEGQVLRIEVTEVKS